MQKSYRKLYFQKTQCQKGYLCLHTSESSAYNFTACRNYNECMRIDFSYSPSELNCFDSSANSMNHSLFFSGIITMKYLQVFKLSITLSTINSFANKPSRENKPICIPNTINELAATMKSTVRRAFPTSIFVNFLILMPLYQFSR